MKKLFNCFIFIIGILFLPNSSLNSHQLYIGVNYHPHDNKQPEKIKNDIQLMKAAGLNVVRMVHLAWDSYEPSDGKFDHYHIGNFTIATYEPEFIEIK